MRCPQVYKEEGETYFSHVHFIISNKEKSAWINELKTQTVVCEITHKEMYKVNFLPGARCKVDPDICVFSSSLEEEVGGEEGRFDSYLRVSWGFYEADELVEGVERLHRGWTDWKEKGGGN